MEQSYNSQAFRLRKKGRVLRSTGCAYILINYHMLTFEEVVVANGFEPSTSWSRTSGQNHISRCPGVTYWFSCRSLMDKSGQATVECSRLPWGTDSKTAADFTCTITALGPASAARTASFKRLYRTRAEQPAQLRTFEKTRVRYSSNVISTLPLFDSLRSRLLRQLLRQPAPPPCTRRTSRASSRRAARCAFVLSVGVWLPKIPSI